MTTAPAAADTLERHLADTNRAACDYDLIITGDLGHVGYDLMVKLMAQKGVEMPRDHYMDCGAEIFAPDQDAHAGGSGCGCSASVLNSLIFKRLFNGTLNRILFMATGALLSPTSSLQGESIPCIAHAVAIESGGIL